MIPSDTYAALGPVVAKLHELGVAYYIGGSVVSSMVGIPRATLDVDIVADLAPRHVAPLVEALKAAYYIDGRMIQDAIARRSCFNLIHLATSFKVDVFVLKNRPYDRAALARIKSRLVDAGNARLELFLASPEDIILAKLEWFRMGDEVSERQWRDVIGVMKVNGTALDRPYMERWAAELGVADLLARAWKEAEVDGPS
jgi:hypothetical protein